jgi:hypothetical protein
MWIWMSNERFTIAVRVAHDRVVQGPPLVNRFLGRPIESLRLWMQSRPGFREEVL